jgi:hypothetical protein
MASDVDFQRCPCCGRAFRDPFDYARVRSVAFERLPVPEAVDNLSEAAVARLRARRRADPHKSSRLEGINLTPEIEQACRAAEVSHYLDRLAAMMGCVFSPRC